MKCPKCQFENREGAKFCSECAHKFELICPDCGATNRPGAKYCDECGKELTLPSEPLPRELSFDEMYSFFSEMICFINWGIAASQPTCGGTSCFHAPLDLYRDCKFSPCLNDLILHYIFFNQKSIYLDTMLIL